MATITGVTGKTVTGTTSADTIYVKGAATGYGKAGNDAMIGDASSNNLQGDTGNDTIKAGSGNDAGYGGDGNDAIYGEAGNDILWGGNGDDALNGGTGYDALNGGAGNDKITGGSGARFDGGAGNDFFDWNLGAANISSLAYKDPQSKFVGGDGTDTLRITNSSTYLDYDGLKQKAVANVFLDGYTENGKYVSQSFLAVGGEDFYSSDSIVADISGTERFEFAGAAKGYFENRGSQSATVIGSNQADTLLGGSGIDNLSGGNGNDQVWGGYGNDTLNGGAGNDRIGGGLGNDAITGGSGNDIFRFSDDDGKDRITDFAKGFDKIHLLLVPANTVKVAQVGSDTTITYGDDTITLTGVTGVKAGVDFLFVSE